MDFVISQVIKEKPYDHTIDTENSFTNLSFHCCCSVLQFMSNSLRPHGLQHARLPSPSPSPRACSNSCPLRWWCHSAIYSSVFPFSSCLQSFPASMVFSSGSALHISWPKYWSFSLSISLPNEYSVLISFRMDWLDLLGSKGLSRIFSNITVQKHQFFGTQLSI